MAHFYRLMLALFVLCVHPVYAATLWRVDSPYVQDSQLYPTADAACRGAVGKASGAVYVGINPEPGGTYDCRFRWSTMDPGSSGSFGTVRPVQGDCPAGYKEENGECVEDRAPTPDEFCSQESFKWNAWSTEQSRIGIVQDARNLPLDAPFQVCMPVEGGDAGSPPGCKHSFTPQTRYRLSDTDPWRYEGDSWALGPNDLAAAGGTLACVPGLDNQPGDPPIPRREDPKPGCEGGIPGQVNGVDVCVDPASGYTEGVDWTQVTDADGNVKEQKTNVTCSGEQCTVTTTTKTPGDPGEGTTTSTTTTRAAYCAKNPASSVCAGATDPTGSTRNQNGRGGPGDPASGGGGGGEGDGFCKENPDLPICKQSSFGGSCGAWTCEGDAIQCAIAKEQHQRACKLIDDHTSQEAQLYASSKGKDGNVTADLPGNSSLSFGSEHYDSTALLGGGSCVSDLSVEVFGKVVSLPLSNVCPYVQWLRTILLAIGALLWMVIVFKG